jgi:hypothetical protein
MWNARSVGPLSSLTLSRSPQARSLILSSGTLRLTLVPTLTPTCIPTCTPTLTPIFSDTTHRHTQHRPSAAATQSALTHEPANPDPEATKPSYSFLIQPSPCPLACPQPWHQLVPKKKAYRPAPILRRSPECANAPLTAITGTRGAGT